MQNLATPRTWVFGSAPIRENASAVYQSLQSFGAPLEGLAQKDFAEDGFFYQMGLPPVPIDILMGIPGIKFINLFKLLSAS